MPQLYALALAQLFLSIALLLGLSIGSLSLVAMSAFASGVCVSLIIICGEKQVHEQ
jgi:hypothetical protein